MPNSQCAIVYVAAGRQFVTEAYASATSARRWMPHIPIYLKIAQETEIFAEERAIFDRVDVFSGAQFNYIDKCIFLDGVTEENVLFIDGDTYICDQLWDGFNILARFDIAAAHAPWRSAAQDLFGIPSSFPEFNTGVIFCKNNNRVRDVLKNWRNTHNELTKRIPLPHDQPSFRFLLWNSDLLLSVLPPEYNARLIFPTFLSGRAKILHYRHPRIAAVAEFINLSSQPRIFHPQNL